MDGTHRTKKRTAAILLGFFAAATIAMPSAQAADRTVSELIPVGQTVGVKLFSDGVLVVGLSPVETRSGTLSPGRSCGLKEGDVITAINGHSISTMSDLQETISTHKPGDKVRASVDRKGKSLTLDMVLKNSEGNTEAVTRIDESSIGAAFLELTDKEMSDLGVSYGVKVVGVDRDGKFFRAGIRKGDVILAVNNLRVSKKEDVDKIVSEVVSGSSDKVLFVKLINTNGRINYVAVDLRD